MPYPYTLKKKKIVLLGECRRARDDAQGSRHAVARLPGYSLPDQDHAALLTTHQVRATLANMNARSLTTYIRKRRVAALLSFGLTYAEVAAAMRLAPSTVRNYMRDPEVVGHINAICAAVDARCIELKVLRLATGLRASLENLDSLEQALQPRADTLAECHPVPVPPSVMLQDGPKGVEGV